MRPRLLILNLYTVHPPDSGAKVVIYNRIEQLAQQFEITFCCLDEGPMARESLEAVEAHAELIQARPTSTPGWRSRLDPVRYPAAGIFSRNLGRWFASEEFEGLTRDRVFDIVEIHSSCWYRREIDRLPGLKVLIVHNDEAEYWRGRARALGSIASPAERVRAHIDAVQVARQQRRAFRAVDAAVTLSPRDARRLKALTDGAPVLTNWGGVDCAFYDEVADSIPEPASPPTLTLVAALFVDPAAEAAARFAQEVLPDLRSSVSDLRLFLVGDHRGHPLVEPLAEIPGIELTGRVPDVRPYLAAADVIVAPITYGSGIRLKLMEACASGRAIVTTRKGAEGLGLRNDQQAVIVDSVAEMSEPIQTLLADDSRRRELGHRARRYARERFDRERCHRELADWYRDLLADPPTARNGRAL